MNIGFALFLVATLLGVIGALRRKTSVSGRERSWRIDEYGLEASDPVSGESHLVAWVSVCSMTVSGGPCTFTAKGQQSYVVVPSSILTASDREQLVRWARAAGVPVVGRSS